MTNNGYAAARDVVLTAPLPSGLERVSAPPQCLGYTTIVCSLGDLYPGQGAPVTLAVRPLQTGSVTTPFAADSPTPDSEPTDNAAAVSVSVQALPRFATPPGPGFSFQLSRPSFADDPTYTTYPWVGEWPKTPGVFQSSTGTLHGALLYVDFPDAHGDTSAVSPETSAGLLRSAASNWFEEASYGRFRLDLQLIPGWFRMSKPSAAYGIGQCCSLPNARAFVQEAISKADPTVDFSHVDALWVIGPAEASPNMTILIDQRWTGGGITVDGHELKRWITAPASYPSVPAQIEPARFSDWVVTHESGHLLGLPDLYLKPPGCPACANTFEPVGWWDMMSDVPLHAHYLAWHKWLLGWIDQAQVRGLSAPGVVDTVLAPNEAPGGVKMVVVPITPSTAYVVEAREPLGWDSGLCDRGVLVYTVDSTKRNAEGPVNIKPAHPTASDSPCGAISQAAYDVGAGEVSTFQDAGAGVKVEVLGRNGDGSYHVKVTKS